MNFGTSKLFRPNQKICFCFNYIFWLPKFETITTHSSLLPDLFLVFWSVHLLPALPCWFSCLANWSSILTSWQMPKIPLKPANLTQPGGQLKPVNHLALKVGLKTLLIKPQDDFISWVFCLFLHYSSYLSILIFKAACIDFPFLIAGRWRHSGWDVHPPQSPQPSAAVDLLNTPV